MLFVWILVICGGVDEIQAKMLVQQMNRAEIEGFTFHDGYNPFKPVDRLGDSC